MKATITFEIDLDEDVSVEDFTGWVQMELGVAGYVDKTHPLYWRNLTDYIVPKICKIKIRGGGNGS